MCEQGRREGGSATRMWVAGHTMQTRACCGFQERKEFGLQVHPLWPTVLIKGAAYNTAEPSTCSRDLRTKTDYSYRRVRKVV